MSEVMNWSCTDREALNSREFALQQQATEAILLRKLYLIHFIPLLSVVFISWMQKLLAYVNTETDSRRKIK